MSTQPLVLVADDEPRITKLVSIALGEEGFRVVTANSGEEALQKAEEVRPDIVLLDIVMPDLDGIEVMRQLREWRPVPVILLTAKGSTADKAKGLDLGADDYIAKPFHPDELAARVRAVLRRSSGAQPGAGDRRLRRHRDRPRAADGHQRRRARPAVAHRVAAAAAPRRERRQGRAPHRAADQGLGPGVPRRPPVPAGLGLARPAQAGRRSPASPAASRHSRASATCSTSSRRRCLEAADEPRMPEATAVDRARRAAFRVHGGATSVDEARCSAASPADSVRRAIVCRSSPASRSCTSPADAGQRRSSADGWWAVVAAARDRPGPGRPSSAGPSSRRAGRRVRAVIRRSSRARRSVRPAAACRRRSWTAARRRRGGRRRDGDGRGLSPRSAWWPS